MILFVLSSKSNQVCKCMFLVGRSLRSSGDSSETTKSGELCVLLLSQHPEICLPASGYGADVTPPLAEFKSSETTQEEKRSIGESQFLLLSYSKKIFSFTKTTHRAALVLSINNQDDVELLRQLWNL
jgi:hypothetical protein